MAFLNWRNDFSVGIALFDEEHKQLFAIINELHETIVSGANPDTLENILNDLIVYTFLHFQHEEMYFEDWNYPEATEHIVIHAKLRQQVFEFRQQVHEKNACALATELAEFLRNWLSNHILIEDRKYGEFLRKK